MQTIESLANPFPGLRPFESTETHLFFGRDGQSEELLRRLKRTRFLAVVGTSGSGKSSLVRAGLLPALQGGLMASAGSDWRIAILRPGGDPIGNLASALAASNVLGTGDEKSALMQTALAETTLRRSSLGLVELVRRARTKLDGNGQPLFPDYENLLVVVDQFEELFRFKQLIEKENSKEDAAAFVKLLLEAVRQQDEKIYVVLTMRSDFLGDCSQFQELPEAINNGQYLIPRMTRDERREAITGPVAVGQGAMTEPLVNQLLNDVGDNPDQLPILQHALMRTWDYWLGHRRNGEPIDLPDYNAIGGMAEALSRHADEAYAELSDGQEVIAEKLFKGLTEKGTDNREIRRPMELQEICKVTDASEAAVIAVIEIFRRKGRSFLMPPTVDALTGASVHLNAESLIDISHESLIRNWERLKKWVDEESRSARIYRRLAETAVLHKEGEAGLLRDPELQIALAWREESRPNAVWAQRYHPEFALSMDFLDRSVAARDEQQASEEARRKKEITRTRLTALVFALGFLFSMGMGVLAYGRKVAAETATRKANDALAYATEQKQKAEKAQGEIETALEQAKDANGRLNKAQTDLKLSLDDAKQEAIKAETARKVAETAQREAQQQTEIARAAEVKARQEIVKNKAAKDANDKFREGVANAQRGDFRGAQVKLAAAIARYESKDVANEEAAADAEVQVGYLNYTAAYDNFVETNGDFELGNTLSYIDDTIKKYDEAAKIYASPRINAPEKAAVALFNLGNILMQFTNGVPAGFAGTGSEQGNLLTSTGLDVNVPNFSIGPKTLPISSYSSTLTYDPVVKFKSEAAERYRQSFAYYEQARKKFERTDQAKADNVRVAMQKVAYQSGNSNLNEANAARSKGADPKVIDGYRQQAIKHFETLLSLYKEGDKENDIEHDIEVTRLLVLLGALHRGTDDPEAAERYFQRALAAYRSESPGNYTEANGLANVAAVAEEYGQSEVAVELYKRSRMESGGDILASSNALYNLGLIYEKESDTASFNRAIFYYGQAAASYETFSRTNTDAPVPLENLLHIGSVAKGIGKGSLALKAYTLVNKFAEKDKNPYFTTRVVVKDPYIELDHAQALAEMAPLLPGDQPQEAVKAYTSALTIYRELASKSKDQTVKAKAEKEVERIGKIVESLEEELKRTPDK